MTKIARKFAKYIIITLLTLCPIFCAFISACANAPQNGSPNSVKIDGGYTAIYAFTAEESKAESCESMLDYMKILKAEGTLPFEGENGPYGFYVTSVLGIRSKTVSSSANFYAGYDWSVYTTILNIDGVTYSDDTDFITYNDLKLFKAGYGVSGIPCKAGESYALVYKYSELSF